MDEPVKITDDLIVQNFYPDADSIIIVQANNGWNIIVSRDEDNEVHISIVDNIESTQVDLVLGKDGFTQKC